MALRTRSAQCDSDEAPLINCVPHFSVSYRIPAEQVDENAVTVGADFRQDDSTVGKRYELRAEKIDFDLG